MKTCIFASPFLRAIVIIIFIQVIIQNIITYLDRTFKDDHIDINIRMKEFIKLVHTYAPQKI